MMLKYRWSVVIIYLFILYLYLCLAEDKVQPPEPTEADGADVIAGVAIAACCVGVAVIVVFDLSSIKASINLLMQNIRTISAP